MPEQNQPVAATESVVLTDPALYEGPTPESIGQWATPAPTWGKANARDIWAWIGIGVLSTLVLEVVAAAGVAIVVLAR